MVNPFNQKRFRGEHEIGRSYQDIRKVVENLDVLKLLADNVKNLRSGNIELSSSGSMLRWKYVNESLWHDLVDLQVLVSDFEGRLNQFEGSLQSFNAQLENFNDIVTNLQVAQGTAASDISELQNKTDSTNDDLDSLAQRVEDTEAFEARILASENSINTLLQRVEALENPEGD